MRFTWRKRNRIQGGNGRSSSLNNKNTLNDLLPGEEAQINIVPDQPLLPPLGFRPGKIVRVWAREQFGGPLIVEIEGRKVALGLQLARDIIIAKESGLSKNETC